MNSDWPTDFETHYQTHLQRLKLAVFDLKQLKPIRKVCGGLVDILTIKSMP